MTTVALCVLASLVTVCAEPRRVPKIYNAVITSSENLEPSRAYPIVQPVFRPAAVAYQVQVPYVPQPADLAAIPQFPPQNLGSYPQDTHEEPKAPEANSYPANIGVGGNQVKIEPSVGPSGASTQPISIGAAGFLKTDSTIIQSQQAFGNLFQNQGVPGHAHGFVSIHTYPSNVSPSISPNIAQTIARNLAQSVQPQEVPQIPLQPQEVPQQALPQQTYTQQNFPQQQSQNFPQQQSQNFPQQQPHNYPQQSSQSFSQQSPPQQNYPQQPPPPQNYPQQSPQPQTYPQQQPKFQDHILNNSHRDRTIPDVPPPPLPTARGRLPVERPPPPPAQ